MGRGWGLGVGDACDRFARSRRRDQGCRDVVSRAGPYFQSKSRTVDGSWATGIAFVQVSGEQVPVYGSRNSWKPLNTTVTLASQ